MDKEHKQTETGMRPPEQLGLAGGDDAEPLLTFDDMRPNPVDSDYEGWGDDA